MDIFDYHARYGGVSLPLFNCTGNKATGILAAVFARSFVTMNLKRDINRVLLSHAVSFARKLVIRTTVN